jgi:hypothetical protein
MRRADVIALGVIGFIAVMLVIPAIARMRHAAYGTQPRDLGMIKVDSTNFSKEVEQSTQPVVVVFYATGFNEMEVPFWKAFVSRNPKLKVVAADRNSGLWSGFNNGRDDSRTFLWLPGLKALPVHLSGDMDFFEGQIYGMIESVAPPRRNR